MAFWRKKIEAREFGGYLLWELAKYGKGAESALVQLLDRPSTIMDVNDRLQMAGVAAIERHRFQMLFTAMLGEFCFHSIREKKLNDLRMGFSQDLPNLFEELAGILSCEPSELSAFGEFATAISERIAADDGFGRNGPIDVSVSGSPGRLMEEAGEALLTSSFNTESVLVKNLSDPAKQSSYLMTLAISTDRAYRWGSEFYKQFKIV